MPIHHAASVRRLLLALAAACLVPLHAADEGLIVGAEFDNVNADLTTWTSPQDWHRDRYQQGREDEVAFARVSEAPAQVSRKAELPAGVGELLFAARFRADAVVSGPKAWDNPVLTLALLDAEDNALNKPWATRIVGQGGQGWRVEAKRIAIPAGTAAVELTLAYKAQAGAFDLDWVRVYDAAKAPAELLAAAPAAEQAQQGVATIEASLADDLIPQTNFAGTSDVPPGWQAGEPWMAKGFRRHPRGFLIMDKIPGQDGHWIETSAPIDPSQVPRLRMYVTMNGRAHRMAHTEDVSQRPRLELTFEGDAGAPVGEPLVIPITGFLTHNALQSVIGEVPSAARRMRLKAIYHGKQGDLTLRGLHVVPATGDEPAWMHRPAHIPAGANAPHPIGSSAPVFADASVLAREPGAAVDESQVRHRLQAAPGDDLQAVWQEVRAALDRGEGVKLSLAAGDYRLEAPLLLTDLGAAAREAVLVFEGAAPGAVRLSGAVAAGFEPATWELVDAERRIYRHAWDHDWGFVCEGYYQPRHVLSHRRELLFLDDRRLDQEIIEGTTFVDRKGRIYNSVGLIVEQQEGQQGGYTYTGFRGLEVLDPGEFAVAELGPGDKTYDGHPHPNSILLRLPEDMSDLSGTSVEVALTSELLRVERKSNLVLRNLVFERTASHYNNRQASTAVEIGGAIDDTHDVLVEHCTFRDHNGKGLGMGNLRNITLRHVQVSDNGCFGMGLHHNYNVLAEDLDVLRNNWRGRLSEATIHSTGGISWSAERAIFRRCRFNDNYGTGWRSDVWVIDVLAEDCEFNRNQAGSGVGHEIGWGPIVHRRCEARDNGGSGFHLTNNRDVRFEDCVASGNGELALELYAMPERISRPSLIERDMYFVHHNERITLENCTFSAAGEGRLIGQKFGQGSIDHYHTTIEEHYSGTSNRFWHPETTQVFETTTGYAEREWTDLAGWQAETGEDQDSVWAAPE